jgi:hypothetical protein
MLQKGGVFTLSLYVITRSAGRRQTGKSLTDTLRRNQKITGGRRWHGRQ